MTTLKTFIKRLEVRLSCIQNNKEGVRVKAQQVKDIINNEVEIIENYNSVNGTFINDGGLFFLAYKFGSVPKTTVKQKVWFDNTINNLKGFE